MNNRFIRIGDLVIAINHIVDVRRYHDGDVDVYLTSHVESIRLYASNGEAQAFWSWLTSALNTTTLQIPSDNREAAVIS